MPDEPYACFYAIPIQNPGQSKKGQEAREIEQLRKMEARYMIGAIAQYNTAVPHQKDSKACDGHQEHVQFLHQYESMPYAGLQ